MMTRAAPSAPPARAEILARQVARISGARHAVPANLAAWEDYVRRSIDDDSLNSPFVFVVFRGYMEPATAASPDSNELVWDQAIYFGPYFEEP